MGKWNKASPEVSQQFLQNQQRRRHMIIQASKRRKQKQKKQLQQAQVQRKCEQQALTRHKRQKKDCYIKYLRNNMHDKYQQMKHQQKSHQPQIRTKNKWKKSLIQAQIQNNNNLQGLDLQVNISHQGHKQMQNRASNIQGTQDSYRQNLTKQNSCNNNKLEQPYKHSGQQYKPFTQPQKQSGQPQKARQAQKRRMLQNQFENMWKEENDQDQIQYDLSVEQSVFQDMIGSKLIDSLDLDFNTITRGKKLDKQVRQTKNNKVQDKNHKAEENKDINQIKNMIGYQSVLVSIDQRSQMIKKYNHFMHNQVQKSQPLTQIQIQTSKDSNKKHQKRQKINKSLKDTEPLPSKPMNQGQFFNQLKNKKQGKILNWALEEVSQADDLFSNCSTNKKSKTRGFQMLKLINKDILSNNKKVPLPKQNQNLPCQQSIDMKKKQKLLQIIPQKRINASRQKLRQRSYDKKTSTQQTQNNDQNKSHQVKRSVSRQKIIQPSKPLPNKQIHAQNRQIHIQNSIPSNTIQVQKTTQNSSKQIYNKTSTNSFKQNQLSEQQSNLSQPRTRPGRSLSRQKQVDNKQVAFKIGTGFKKNMHKAAQVTPVRVNVPVPGHKLSQLPPRRYQHADQITVATQDQVFQVQSFIKNELLQLNKEQRQIQEELRTIHVANKEKIRQVQSKYDIRTNFKYSHQLEEKQEGGQDGLEGSRECTYGQLGKRQTEDELEESIQRLDDMLLRREILEKQKISRITEQDNQSQSTTRSIINPMCDPISLHKQVLQLAQNLSRFQGQPQDIQTGYGGKLRTKNRSLSKNNQVSTHNNHPQPSQSYQQSQGISRNQKHPTQIQMSQSQDVNLSELNPNNQKQSQVSKPPQLKYANNNCQLKYADNKCYMPYNESDLLDDKLDDSIQKGKIQVNQRLRKMLLE